MANLFPIFIIMFMTTLEIAVLVIQAYVFTLLYIRGDEHTYKLAHIYTYLHTYICISPTAYKKV